MDRARVRVAIVMLAGCAGAGRQLSEWTLDVDGGPRAMALTLPDALFRGIPWREADFVIRADVPLEAGERGRSLTLAFDCFHGPLAVSVDGVELEDIGDVGVGEHRYVIASERTRGASLAVTAAGHKEIDTTGYGFGAAPRLVVGTGTRSSIVIANRAFAMAAATFVLVMTLLFGTLYVLDRRRVADAAFTAACLCAVVPALWALGIAPMWLFGASMCGIAIANLYFFHLDLELGPPPRWLVAAFATVALAFVVTSR